MDKIILQNYNKFKLLEINKDFLYSNLKEIFKLENAENIVELADEITKYNVLYIELISEINSRKREMILEELKVLGENFEVNIEILESISSLLNSVTLVFFSNFNKKSLLDIIKQEAEEIVKSYKEKSMPDENEWENLVEELIRYYKKANYKDIYWKLSLLIDHIISNIKKELLIQKFQINEISKVRVQEAEEQEKFEKLVQFLDFFENKIEYHKLIEAKFNIYSGIEKQIEKL